MTVPPGCPTDARLIQAERALRDQFVAMAHEFVFRDAAHAARWTEAITDFDAYFRRHELPDAARLATGLVAWTSFWLLREDGTVIGRSSLRHQLNAFLLREGGHIGYAIRPSARRKGYGTLLCALTLDEAERLGLSRVLITCDADNTGSRRIIEKNGGVLEDCVTSANDGRSVLRFWITLRSAQAV